MSGNTSAKLDTSLDDILKNERSSRRGRGNRRGNAARRTTAAPVGGVQKPAKQAKPTKAAPAVPTGPAGGEAKIMISNLPLDVEEAQLKDYFATAVGVGKPKRIMLQYGANGKSLGSATVVFHRQDQAQKATAALQGVKIDTRPIRVEMLVNAAALPVTRQPTLADRVTQPKKDKPKPATASKEAPAGTRGRERGRGRGRARGGRGGADGRDRGKKKTLEELDAEMDDYFPAGEGGNDATATNGAAPAAAGGDTAMDDEML